jgi:uncharacterized membrane protein
LKGFNYLLQTNCIDILSILPLNKTKYHGLQQNQTRSPRVAIRPLGLSHWRIPDIFTDYITSGSPKIGGLITLLTSGALAVGYAKFGLNIAQNQEAKLDDLFWGFKQFGRSLGAMLLVGVFVILWTLALIIPGIIAAYSYSMVSYI